MEHLPPVTRQLIDHLRKVFPPVGRQLVTIQPHVIAALHHRKAGEDVVIEHLEHILQQLEEQEGLPNVHQGS
jgi:hypothetical protein